MRIKILPNERGVPQAKLADAEIVFEEEGVLCGLKLVGFAVWEGREGPHVTFPARPFVANGERRMYTLLRPVRETDALEQLRQLIMQAFVDFHHPTAPHSTTGHSSTGHSSTGHSSTVHGSTGPNTTGPNTTGHSPTTGRAPLDETPIEGGSLT